MATVLVTGANRGIGLGLVKELLKSKATKTVIATCRNPEQAGDLAAIKDQKLHVVTLEATSDKSIEECYKQVEKIVGPSGLNMLVNNAGILLQYFTEKEIDRATVNRQLDVNTTSVVILSQVFLPLLKLGSQSAAGAKIVNISSELGSMSNKEAEMGSGPFGLLAYRLSKAAMNSMTKCMAIDLAPLGIITASYAPGWIQTDLGGPHAPLKVEDSVPHLIMATILVTGANRGIGLALVKEFLQTDQVKILIATCRNPEQTGELNNIKDSRLKIVKLEVTQDNSIKECFKEVEKIVGDSGLNMLVNNAGAHFPYFFDKDVDRALINKQLDVNTTSVVILTQIFLPLLKSAAKTSAGAKIINISSGLASMTNESSEKGSGPYGFFAYRLSKAALNSMTKCMAVDLASDGIITGAYAPGWIQTEMGGPSAPLKLEDSIPHLVKAFFALKKDQSGGYFNRFGEIELY